ncbi:MAG: hypothetical protein JNL42_19265 [Anaerolineae bacterium]|nr:hypothetical protein [Anaerolineae bacterium]
MAFRRPLVKPETPVRETPSASFGDLVRMLAEGIADAQASLDRASAAMVVELANTKVEMIPAVTETIDENGNVAYSSAEPQEVSLLHLGVRPTFYQFSQAVVEVVMDIKIVENDTESGDRRYTLFADTSNVRFERKLNRDVKVSSKLTATLVPVPMPLRLEPAQTTHTPPVEG